MITYVGRRQLGKCFFGVKANKVTSHKAKTSEMHRAAPLISLAVF